MTLTKVKRFSTYGTTELVEILARNVDSRHQFKANVTNELSLAAEMIAFSNTLGGMIVIGANNDGTVSGLGREDMGRLSNLVSNTASQQVRPPINPITENIATAEGIMMVVHLAEGISKPYMDKNGAIWVKNGSFDTW